jgi:catechol 2,3-dioxygenase-like lactoylglutathione lyase family enzyme
MRMRALSAGRSAAIPGVFRAGSTAKRRAGGSPVSDKAGFGMIAHISIGVSDIGKSKRFYDATLEPLGYRCIRAARAATGYGYGAETIALWVLFAEHPVAPDEQSGFHVCFAASSAAAVDAFHAAALRSGGRDNGRPGLRPEYAPDYYAAFVVDPDGYRIEAYFGPGET